MDAALLKQLNGIFGPPARRAAALASALKQKGVPASRGWYANHSVRVDGRWQTEEFAIPLVEVGGLGDVGFDLDGVWLELRLPREKALTFDYAALPAPFEVYGLEDYLTDFYHEGMDPAELSRRIAESGEREIGAALSFPADIPAEELAAVVLNFIKEDKPNGLQTNL